MKNILINLGMVLRKYPNLNLIDALSKGQINSKLWLIDELAKITTTPGVIFILGGWYGTLSALMFESEKFSNIKIRSYDLDPECTEIADILNSDPWLFNEWQFKAFTANMYEINYSDIPQNNCFEPDIRPNIIINTACEHLEEFDKWWSLIPKNTLCVLQSNDFTEIDDNVNCVSTIDEFIEQTQFSEILYSGSLTLIKYTRFMIIGRK